MLEKGSPRKPCPVNYLEGNILHEELVRIDCTVSELISMLGVLIKPD
jgi:hypothetical protein